MDKVIHIKGAAEHNLKNVEVKIPKNKLIVITGVSGSGKSSLMINTLFAEGQRRYVESLSAYARQFLSRMTKPKIDFIKGLSPTIAIQQKVLSNSPRSTVGSMTEIYDYFRILFARMGKTYSPISGKEVIKHDVDDVIKHIQNITANTKIYLLVKSHFAKNKKLKDELNLILQKGFTRVAVNYSTQNFSIEVLRIEDLMELSDSDIEQKLFQKKSKKEIYILVDRLVAKKFDEDEQHRLSDSIQTAFDEGEGNLFLHYDDKLIAFSNLFEMDGMSFEMPNEHLFNFNSPAGACPTCEGYSKVMGIDHDLVIPNKSLSVYEGAVAAWSGEKMNAWKKQFINASVQTNFPIHKPIYKLSKEEYKLLWHGEEDVVYGINDFFKEVESNFYKIQYRVLYSRYRGKTTCPDCLGMRIRKEATYIKLNGCHIGELNAMPVADLMEWMKELRTTLSVYEQELAKRILLEINIRIEIMVKMGLGYLTLDRLSGTLSGGESQRILLTKNIGSNLTDSIYIFDEPSIGLHSRDTANLIAVLKNLRDLHNTVIVIEHDEMMMQEADYIIDMGPFASHLGGEVVAVGTKNELVQNEKSLTGKYLSKEMQVVENRKIRKYNSSIKIIGARENNLKNISVEFPLNVLCVVTGVSGSGKSTLVQQILYPALQRAKNYYNVKPGEFDSLTGDVNLINTIEMIDQNPIGKSSRSNPITYIGAYDFIRNIYASQPLSKMRYYEARHFSFNVDGGRCDTCKGEGEQIIEMQFLADVNLICESCKGKKFKDEILEVRYKEKNIYDVLEMSVDEAIDFFKDYKALNTPLQSLSDVGLGYIKLGQSANTLSGGEAQRVKLASFLANTKQLPSLFIFDEPTTGLHFHDIKKLLSSFNKLLDAGHSIIVIEHNVEVIRSADWIIDLGPDAGNAGGELVYEGTLDGLKKCKQSFTAKYL